MELWRVAYAGLTLAVLGGIACALVALNVWHRRCRTSLTPEQRAAEDEETDREMKIW